MARLPCASVMVVATRSSLPGSSANRVASDPTERLCFSTSVLGEKGRGMPSLLSSKSGTATRDFAPLVWSTTSCSDLPVALRCSSPCPINELASASRLLCSASPPMRSCMAATSHMASMKPARLSWPILSSVRWVRQATMPDRNMMVHNTTAMTPEYILVVILSVSSRMVVASR